MSEGTEKPQRRYVYRKKKVCKFCEEKIPFIDYKDVNLLRLFVPERGRGSRDAVSGRGVRELLQPRTDGRAHALDALTQ